LRAAHYALLWNQRTFRKRGIEELNTSTAHHSARLKVAGLIVAAAAVRCIMAWKLPLGDDEAHYWAWSCHPAACYFDHPGMVAWLIWITRHLLGDTPLAVRLPTILVGAASTYVIYYLGSRLFNEKAGLWSAVLFTIIPLYALGSFLSASDGPMGLLWMLTVLFAAEAVIFGRRNFWYAAGLTLGLAMASKFTAVLLVPSALGFLATSRKTRREFARPQIWVAAVIALGAFLPVLLWNHSHGWASFVFNAEGRHKGATLQSKWLLQLIVVEMLVLSPFVFAGLWASLVRGIKLSAGNQRIRLLVWCSALPLSVFWGASLITRILPHWPAPGYLTLLVLGCALSAGVAGRPARPAWKALVVGAAVLLTLVLHIQPFWRIVPLSAKEDNSNHLYGWDVVTPVIRLDYEEMGGDRGAYLFSDRYQFASQLCWNLRQPDRTFSLNPRMDQFDFWMDRKKMTGANGVLVWEDNWGINPVVLKSFTRVEEAQVIPIYRQGKRIRRFHILRCYGLRRIP